MTAKPPKTSAPKPTAKPASPEPTPTGRTAYLVLGMHRSGPSAVTQLLALAGALHLSAVKLRDALENGDYAPKVRSDFLGGVRSGVNGTPTFFINGVRHEGSYQFTDLAAAVDAHLHAKAPT